MTITTQKPASRKRIFENNKLSKRLCRLAGKAIGDFDMIQDGDKVMVCVSGGKDSFALLDILLMLQARAPIHFDIIAVNLDQKLPGFPDKVIPDYLSKRDIPFHIENQDIYSIIERLMPEGKASCSLCARLRRGVLYSVASQLGVTKIALGHHRDDILETFFLNLFFGAKLKSMPPKLQSNDGKHIVIRPLAYVKESNITRYAEVKQFPIISYDCGARENLQRKHIKSLMREWEKKFPGRVENIFSALSTVVPSHLMDKTLFDFVELPTGKMIETPESSEEYSASTEDEAISIQFFK